MSSSAAPIDQQSEVTYPLQEFVRVLTKRPKWIIGSIVICALLAITETVMTKRTYQANAFNLIFERVSVLPMFFLCAAGMAGYSFASKVCLILWGHDTRFSQGLSICIFGGSKTNLARTILE
jgi:hypothetical protein